MLEMQIPRRPFFSRESTDSTLCTYLHPYLLLLPKTIKVSEIENFVIYFLCLFKILKSGISLLFVHLIDRE